MWLQSIIHKVSHLFALFLCPHPLPQAFFCFTKTNCMYFRKPECKILCICKLPNPTKPLCQEWVLRLRNLKPNHWDFQLLNLANQFWKKRPETLLPNHFPTAVVSIVVAASGLVSSRLLNRFWFFYLLCCLPTFLFHSTETISEWSLPSHLHVYIPHPFRCGIPQHLPGEELLPYIKIT